MQYDGDKRVVNNVNVLDKETRNKEIRNRIKIYTKNIKALKNKKTHFMLNRIIRFFIALVLAIVASYFIVNESNFFIVLSLLLTTFLILFKNGFIKFIIFVGSFLLFIYGIKGHLEDSSSYLYNYFYSDIYVKYIKDLIINLPNDVVIINNSKFYYETFFFLYFNLCITLIAIIGKIKLYKKSIISRVFSFIFAIIFALIISAIASLSESYVILYDDNFIYYFVIIPAFFVFISLRTLYTPYKDKIYLIEINRTIEIMENFNMSYKNI